MSRYAKVYDLQIRNICKCADGLANMSKCLHTVFSPAPGFSASTRAPIQRERHYLATAEWGPAPRPRTSVRKGGRSILPIARGVWQLVLRSSDGRARYW